MRIAIDGRELVAGTMTGIGRYLTNLLRHATSARPHHSFVLYANQRTGPIAPAANLTVRRLPERVTLWWDQHVLPRALAADRVDVFLSPYPKIPLRAACPRVCTIHDLTFLRVDTAGTSVLSRRLLRHWYRLLVGRAARVITDSEHSRRDIRELLGAPADKLDVVPIALPPNFKPASNGSGVLRTARKYGVAAPYLLYVGNFKPHKNLPRLLEAFRRARRAAAPQLCLVLAGSDPDNRAVLDRCVDGLGLASSVVFTGFVNDHDLPHLYAGAEALVLPSLNEGFGLPALEAMACGTPVIASNIASVPEVVGDAGALVDPKDTEEMSRAIQGLVGNPTLRQDLARRGIARSKRFTLEATAGRILEIVERVGGGQ